MKYYKDINNTVHAFKEDGSQDHLIGDKTPITKEEAEALGKAGLEAEFDAQDYYRKRIFSYPEMGQFLDAWVKGDNNALEEYRRACLEVKAKYPKPPGF
jgi:hypothetical protein